MIINHNIMAMNALRQFNIVGKQKTKSVEKLSSGYKINRAADDAAGLSISEKMRRQIRGLNQGIKNTQDGVALCQVADGALAEVSDMLHRLEELSVKAANGTNSQGDRQMIQQEVSQLLTEIDRIGDTTTFNELHIFRGEGAIKLSMLDWTRADGTIPFEDFTLADVNLGSSPFGPNSPSNRLQLQAVVDNPESIMNGNIYNLIFGDGSTSHSSIRLSYEREVTSESDAGTTMEQVTQVVSFDDLPAGNYDSGVDENGNSYWTRDFTYQNEDGVEFTITQRIAADNSGETEKNYKVSYSFTNSGDVDVNMDFMFHVDTAYNNDDLCEGYFVNGNRINESCIFSKNNSVFTAGQDHPGIIDEIPDSLSIIDMDNALAFSERISFSEGGKPDSFSIGHYNSIHNWDYYDSLDNELGQNMIRNDLGFSLLWNYEMSSGSSQSVSFNYGIAATESDSNLDGVPLTRKETPTIEHIINRSTKVWIQSGVDAGSGMYLNLGEMNTKVMGINGMNVSSAEGALEALDMIEGALKYITGYRSHVGAMQNRLEHTIANEENIVENTTSAESRIRDTDMSAEMVQYARENILQQVGQAILTQTNQNAQGVLALLR